MRIIVIYRGDTHVIQTNETEIDVRKDAWQAKVREKVIHRLGIKMSDLDKHAVMLENSEEIQVFPLGKPLAENHRL